MLLEIQGAVTGLFRTLPDYEVCVDLGCGQGVIGPVLKSRAKRLIGVSLEGEASPFLKRLKYDEFVLTDIREYSPPEGALITMFDVLEHITKKEGQELLKRLEKHPVIITTPSKFFAVAEGGEHKCVWSEAELEKLGFEVTRIAAGMFQPFYGEILFAAKPPGLFHQAVSVITPFGAGEKLEKTFCGEAEWIKVRGSNVVKNINAGWEKAKSPYVLVIASDVDAHGVDVSTLPKHGYDVASAFFKTNQTMDYLYVLSQNFWATVKSPYGCLGGFMLVKKTVLEELGGFRDMYMEDIDLATRATLEGFTVGSLPVFVTHLRPFKTALYWIPKKMSEQLIV